MFAIVILGGAGSIPGVLLGSFLIVGLPEAFREFANARMLIFGAAMVVMMIFRTQGLLPAQPRTYDLRGVAGRRGQGMSVLSINRLTKNFGGLTAVSNVSFEVEEGGIVGLIGPNGAGKTTVFNLITGIYRPDQGEITFNQTSVLGLPTHRIVALGIGRTFQTIRLFQNLSVLENVLAGATAR